MCSFQSCGGLWIELDHLWSSLPLLYKTTSQLIPHINVDSYCSCLVGEKGLSTCHLRRSAFKVMQTEVKACILGTLKYPQLGRTPFVSHLPTHDIPQTSPALCWPGISCIFGHLNSSSQRRKKWITVFPSLKPAGREGARMFCVPVAGLAPYSVWDPVKGSLPPGNATGAASHVA